MTRYFASRDEIRVTALQRFFKVNSNILATWSILEEKLHPLRMGAVAEDSERTVTAAGLFFLERLGFLVVVEAYHVAPGILQGSGAFSSSLHSVSVLF